VVILRLRGRTGLGTTVIEVLRRYAQVLIATGSKLVIVSAGEHVQDQFRATGITELIAPENIYAGDDRVGAALRRAHTEAVAWIAENSRAAGDDPAV
jgi:SulP family sulfate permease